MAVIWVGFAAFFVVALVVGVRLLLLWRRTGQLPELLIGLGVLGIGPVGYGFIVASDLARGSNPELGRILIGIGIFAVCGGSFAKYLFNWRVYHPRSALAQSVALGAGAILAGVLLYELAFTGFAGVREPGLRFVLRSALQVGALLWGSFEALRYWTRLRRRVPLGLADPVVANRFLLWGIGAGAAGQGSLIGILAQVVMGASTAQSSWVMASSSAHGLTAAIALWLAFVPPLAYRRFIADSSPAAPHAGPNLAPSPATRPRADAAPSA